ncbi:hypothetical protein T4C_1147 [Trichinella pseudospiralis]|uniref:Uncharacterized protein n=2 Tax=Trichinella pseudospiralis TaxID=6337 RepID=A0A0V1K9P9_TRIPS|nr:hypothetical protein T4C_1147 [Trichinella pseudospiralis]
MKITQQFQVVSSCLLCLPWFPARGTIEFLPQFTNDSAEQEQPLRDCPSQRFNKPDSYHNKQISTRFQKSKLRKTTEVCFYRFIVYTSPPMEVLHHTAAGSISCSFRIDLTSVPAADFTRALRFMPSD